MPFAFENTLIQGLTIIRPHVFQDNRGEYRKYFECGEFGKRDIPTVYSEYADIWAAKGSLRGLHYQSHDPQGKLIRLIKGAVFDVAVDIRPTSNTFGRRLTFTLTEEEPVAIYIPPGCAHGFLALEDSVFSYQSTSQYHPASSSGIIWNDPDLNIPWPIDDIGSVILSDTDSKLPTWQQTAAMFSEGGKES